MATRLRIQFCAWNRRPSGEVNSCFTTLCEILKGDGAGMQTPLMTLDWTIILVYLGALIASSIWLSRTRSASMQDYFLGGQRMPSWLVMFSVIATTQSAATFLGGPDYGYRGDFTYVGSFVGSAMAAAFVARFLIGRFYELKVTTVYELLEKRYGPSAKQAAGAMYLVGRVFANGARLYMAALAVSMMLFLNVAPASVVFAALLIAGIALGMTLFGGVRSVIWSDFGQFIVYFGAALVALISLWSMLSLTPGEAYSALSQTHDGTNKLLLFDFSMDLSKPFTFWAIITGVFLLNLGNFGLDQDTTQRLLTCSDRKQSGRALVMSAIVAVPIVTVFVLIGQLLHLFYDRPDLTAGGSAIGEFDGEKITVFMSYILNEMPPGVRGLAVAGVVAAAISTMTSGLNAMSSVLVVDFYRPFREARGGVSSHHYVAAGRWGMLFFALSLSGMAVLCFYWQRYTDMPLIEFALSVMAFAYAGLIGVFFTAVFTSRGSANSVIAALIVGFLVILIQQSYIVDSLGLPYVFKSLAFPWQLVIGVTIATLVCMAGAPRHKTNNVG
jgi:Na+/proline symporter